MAAYPVTGLSPPLLLGTLRAVFRPVRFRQIVAAAEDAFLPVCPVEQGGAQVSIQRQDGGAEPFADQRVGDTLWADTFLAIVQKQTIPAVIIAAAMYQPPRCPVLLVVHVLDHGSFSTVGSLM
jgi:hypothetical protein